MAGLGETILGVSNEEPLLFHLAEQFDGKKWMTVRLPVELLPEELGELVRFTIDEGVDKFLAMS